MNIYAAHPQWGPEIPCAWMALHIQGLDRCSKVCKRTDKRCHWVNNNMHNSAAYIIHHIFWLIMRKWKMGRKTISSDGVIKFVIFDSKHQLFVNISILRSHIKNSLKDFNTIRRSTIWTPAIKTKCPSKNLDFIASSKVPSSRQRQRKRVDFLVVQHTAGVIVLESAQRNVTIPGTGCASAWAVV